MSIFWKRYQNLILTFITPCLFSFALFPTVAYSFVAFESGQVRPLVLSPDGNRLYVVNTPDNRLEIFDVNAGMPNHVYSVNVGMEPTAVAARNNNEIWVANYLSDSISIIDTSSTPPRVIRTLLVGDEPGDIVFAGPGKNRAFITTAHRGQNTPYMLNQDDPIDLASVNGRADVWVFDVNNLGNSLGGDPETIITLFGDTPKALTVSPDGDTVYAAIFKSGNQTTVVNEDVVCDGGSVASSCVPVINGASSPGGLPAPNVDKNNIAAPETGLIVKFDGSGWKDELNRDWSNQVRFSLPDKDVFAIDATANPPTESNAFVSVGTVLFNMAVNPVSGKVYVANTDADNEVRFEGSRPLGSTITTVQGRVHKSRITVIDPDSDSVTPIYLNKHIDYSVSPAPVGVKEKTLATPKGMAVTSDGNTLYVVAKGSAKIGVFDTTQLEANTFVPDSANHITLSAGGPGGLVLDETNDRIYVTTRFDNGISVIDTTTNTEIAHKNLYNPEPASIVAGRPFLFDANFSSSNGESSCASCHVEGDRDELAWDLGNPEGADLVNLNTFFPDSGGSGRRDFHPMKGPMTVRTFRGMANHGPMHWRGDRSDKNNPVPDSEGIEAGSFKRFDVAFEDILGRSGPPTVAEMQAFTDFILQLTPPPNPIRRLDDSLTQRQIDGKTIFDSGDAAFGFQCSGCHITEEYFGPFGTHGFNVAVDQTQAFKVPSLRNLYQKVGMSGMSATTLFDGASSAVTGDQIRGFGFLHDGSVDTISNFLHVEIFDTFLTPFGNSGREDLEQFIFAFESNLKPIVGQQITLTSTNAAVVDPRIGLMIAQTQAENSDLIVKWNDAGKVRGAYMLWGTANFVTDKAAEPNLTVNQVHQLAQTEGREVTYTVVQWETGLRMGIDRDQDTILDGDDNCPSESNVAQTDTSSNGVGDACESIIDTDNDGLTDVEETIVYGMNPLLIDSDADGLTDQDELCYDGDCSDYNPYHPVNNISGGDTNAIVADTDGDGWSDKIEINYGSSPLNPLSLPVIPADGDINVDGKVNVADMLLAQKIVLGLLSPTAEQLKHGDVAPLVGGVPVPDGVIGAGDFLVIQRKVFGLVSF